MITFPQTEGRSDPAVQALMDATREAMEEWRTGLRPLPQAYIDGHEALALKHLIHEVGPAGWSVSDVALVDDGWLDGMKFIQATVQSPEGQQKVIKWSDSGLWYEKLETGGWWLI